jgi:hypothetical protein
MGNTMVSNEYISKIKAVGAKSKYSIGDVAYHKCAAERGELKPMLIFGVDMSNPREPLYLSYIAYELLFLKNQEDPHIYTIYIDPTARYARLPDEELLTESEADVLVKDYDERSDKCRGERVSINNIIRKKWNITELPEPQETGF